jgi:type II secretory pathway component PulF
MQFEYRAKTASGQTTVGAIEADSLAAAHQALRQRELYPLRVNAVARRSGSSSHSTGNLFRRGVAPADLLMVTTQLAIMCQSGIDLAEALRSVAAQCQHPRLQPALAAVYQDVSQGMATSEAMRKFPQVFSGSFVASIEAGERTGTMIDVLQRLNHLLRAEVRLRGTVWSILAYPLVLSIIATGVVAALMLFVLPQFAKVFEDLGQPPPPLTQMLLEGSQWIRSHILLIAVGIAVAVFVFARFRSHPRVAQFRDGLLLNGAIVRNAVRPLLAGRMFRLFGTMLQTGIPLLECIQLCRGSIGNRLYRELFIKLESEVLQGRGIYTAIASAPFLPEGIAQMVATAERSGRLSAVMITVGEYYEDEGERRLRDLARLLEPAIIVLMGAVVAAVVLAIVLPLLDVSTMTHA